MKIFAIAAVSMMLLGCSARRSYSSLAPRMNVTIKNHSSHVLENAVARFGEYECGFGYVAISGNKGWVGFPHPITQAAELNWDENGKHRLVHVNLSKIYPSGKEGRLIFMIYDERVEAAFNEIDFDRRTE